MILYLVAVKKELAYRLDSILFILLIKKLIFGIEYYSGLGSFKKILPGNLQEHLPGPLIDLYVHPMWEVNGGFLFGLTKNFNQHTLKLLLGRRWGK
ncbi:MAG: hypothetical protein LH619_00530 [Chitinophagaceae bacterium]|nr:hypothetical protein [Chitinophagaceae bacterium]